jgi:hypothetical protein
MAPAVLRSPSVLPGQFPAGADASNPRREQGQKQKQKLEFRLLLLYLSLHLNLNLNLNLNLILLLPAPQRPHKTNRQLSNHPAASNKKGTTR